MTKVIAAIKATVHTFTPTVIIGSYVTGFFYLLSLAAHMLTGHYFHWFAAALVTMIAQSLSKLVLPDIASGWHTGRVRAEQRAQANSAAIDFLQHMARATSGDELSDLGQYL